MVTSTRRTRGTRIASTYPQTGQHRRDDRDGRGGHDPGPGRVGDAGHGEREPQHVAQQRPDEQDPDQRRGWCRRCGPPSPGAGGRGRGYISTGNATRATANAPCRPTATGAGHSAPADGQRPPRHPEQQREDRDEGQRERDGSHQRSSRRRRLYGIASSHGRPPGRVREACHAPPGIDHGRGRACRPDGGGRARGSDATTGRVAGVSATKPAGGVVSGGRPAPCCPATRASGRCRWPAARRPAPPPDP